MMECTNYDISRKVPRENFLQKFLLKNDSKENSNVETLTQFAINKSVEEFTPRPNCENLTAQPPYLLKPYLLNANKQNIPNNDQSKDYNHTVMNCLFRLLIPVK